MNFKISVTKNRFSPILFCCLTIICSIVISGCATVESSSNKSNENIEQTSKPITTTKPIKGEPDLLPTPTGTLLAKLQFTCENLQNSLKLNDYAHDNNFAPEALSPEGRAISSGGISCRWFDAVNNSWITVSLENISPEDFRDFAENLSSMNTSEKFGSSNDSLEFYNFSETENSSKLLNTSYLLTVQSNNSLSKQQLGGLAIKSENIFIAQ